MKQNIILMFMFGLATCGKLDHLTNTYLPPHQPSIHHNPQPISTHQALPRLHHGNGPQHSVFGPKNEQHKIHPHPQQQQQNVHPHPQHQQQHVQHLHRQQQQQTVPPIPVLRYENSNDGSGNYHFAYETGNGIQAEERGELKYPGSEQEITSVHGSYSYPSEDGQQIMVHYIADENGFQPSGHHLPTTPLPSNDIQKAVAQNVHEERQGLVVNDGQYREQQFRAPKYLPPL